MRVAHVVFQRDRARRSPSELIEAWPTLTQVAAAVSACGVDVPVVVEHDSTERLESRSVQLHFTPKPFDVLRRIDPAVLHVHGLRFPGRTRSLHSRLPGVPVLVQDHGGGSPARWRHPVLRRGLEFVSAVAFTAREQAEAYRAVLPRDVRIFEVLENSTEFTAGDQSAARASTGLYGDPCVLWNGRLIAGKDPLTALAAVALAARNLPDLHLWCCYGVDVMEAEVRARIAADPVLRERVHLLGRVPHEQVEQLCRAADIFFSTSLAEGSGYALLESLACGTPPVVTDLPPTRAITQNGRVGVLFPPRSAEAAAAAIIATAQADRAALRARTIEHFQSHLTYAALGQQLRSIYEDLGA